MTKLDDLLPGGALQSRLFSRLVHGDRHRDPELPTDAAVGPYRIVSLLGRGGRSQVYLAERKDGLFAERVAIKRVPIRDARTGRAFVRERDILAKLDHPAIARLFESGMLDDGSAWIAMALVDGRRIDRYVREAALGWQARIDLIDAVAGALEHAHAHGLVHRDIKPSNVLVDDASHATLLDFGIALAPKPGGFTGEPGALTPEFASPEQLQGRSVTAASDLYQLGLLLATVLRGDRGFCEHMPEPPPRKIGLALRAVAARACAYDPVARYRSVTVFRSALRAAVEPPSPSWWRW